MADPKTQIVTKGVITQLDKITFTRTGDAQFVGWNTKRDGSGQHYEDQEEIQITSPLTLYAQWGYKITWDSNGGTAVEPRSVLENSQLGTLPTPTKSGYNLDGWYTSLTGGEQITSSNIIRQNATYYAHWRGNTYTKTRKTIPSDHGLLCDTNLPKGNYDIKLEGMYVYHWGEKREHQFHPRLQVFNANNTRQVTIIALNGTLTPQNSTYVYIKKSGVYVGQYDGLEWKDTHWSDGVIVTNLREARSPEFSIEMRNIALPYKTNKVFFDVGDAQDDCGKMNWGWIYESTSQIGATITRL